jgi:hypothetical protein
MYPPQDVDHDIYKLSLQLFRQDRSSFDRKLSLSSMAGLSNQVLPVAVVRG